MSYQAPIQRSAPTALLFIVDQSASMNDRMANSERTKAQIVSDVLNKTLMQLITRCTKADGVRDYFDIGVIGYGGNGANNGLHDTLAKTILNPISLLEANPLRIEQRQRKVDDGAGGIIEQTIRFPVWFEPQANGGTPMCAAITAAAEALAAWCDDHPDSYPPTVLHITDGESTDGDPEGLADALRQFQTNDGTVLLFNLHISSLNAQPISFPASSIGLPDQYASLLYRMSSPLPQRLVNIAKEELGENITSESRGYIFNADAAEIVTFFDIGTRPAQLR